MAGQTCKWLFVERECMTMTPKRKKSMGNIHRRELRGEQSGKDRKWWQVIRKVGKTCSRFLLWLLFISFVYLCCPSPSCVMVCIEQSEDNLKELALSFCHVVPRVRTQVTRLGGKCPSLDSFLFLMSNICNRKEDAEWGSPHQCLTLDPRKREDPVRQVLLFLRPALCLQGKVSPGGAGCNQQDKHLSLSDFYSPCLEFCQEPGKSTTNCAFGKMMTNQDENWHSALGTLFAV